MSRTLNVAVAGATGLVGEALLEQLKSLPLGDVQLFASQESVGKRLQVAGRNFKVASLDTADFSTVELLFNALPVDIAGPVARRAVEAGCRVIDFSGAFVAEPAVAQVVPEINAQALADSRETGIVASPSPAAIQLASVLAVIRDQAGLEQVQATVIESAASAGRRGVEALAGQTARLLNGMDVEATSVFPGQLAFNVHPAVGAMLDTGATHAELRIALETLSVLGERSLPMSVTCLRVPAFYGTGVVVHLQTSRPLSPEEAEHCLANSVGLEVFQSLGDDSWPTAVSHANGQDHILVGRVRREPTLVAGLNLWSVTDNLRKGSALNGVQIAQLLLKHYL